MKRFADLTKKIPARAATFFGVLLFVVIGSFLIPHGVFAADALESVGQGAGLPETSLPILIARIIRAVLGVLGIVTVLLVVYAGFIYMGAKGDSAKVDKAKKIITNAVIGLIIIFSSYSIASYILGKLLDAAFGPGTIVSVAKKYTEQANNIRILGVTASPGTDKATIKKICERYSYENCPDGCIKLKEPSCQFPCTVLQNGKIKCRKIPGCNGDGPICVSPNSKRVFSLKQNIIFSSLLLKII